MTLKQLEAFYWAATCSSFAIAAERLHLSQSSLSKRIGELESSTGKTLFDRAHRRAVLTRDGEHLLPMARSLLTHAEEVAASISAHAAVRGRCRLGVGEIAASSWLPKLVARVRESYPDLTLEPYVDLGFELENRLLSGRLDAAMIARRSSNPLLQSVVLADVEYVWVAARDVAFYEPYVEDLIERYPVVTMSRQAGSTQILDQWSQRSNIAISNAIESNSMVTMAGIVSAGLAIGYLPRGWLKPMFKSDVLRIVKSKVPLNTLEYRFYWRADDVRPLVARLKEVALAVVDYDTPLLML